LPADALDWLSGFPELWAQLLFTLAGQHEYADILGEIVTQADQASVAQELGGNTERAMAAPKQSLQRQLVDGLRMLVKEKFKLNHPDGPSDGWLTQDALWLVSKPAVDQLRASLLAQGIEHIPSSNAPMFNMLQDQAIIQTNAKDKAIWSVTVDNGNGWLKTFTVLKVSPALIWPDAGERPQSYGGSVTIEQSEPISEDPLVQNVESSVHIANPSDGILISKSLQIVQNAPQPLLQSDSYLMDDLLSLFEDTPVAPHPAANTAIVQSTPSPALAEPLQTPPPLVLRQQRQLPSPDSPLEGSHADAAAGDYGSEFLAWLKTGVISHKIIINDAKARVHTVAGTAFLVSPDIFKRYALEHPEIEAVARERQLEAWQLVQRAFEKKKRHRKTPEQLNIWTCQVKGPRKTRELRGYLLTEPTDVFSEVPYDNAILALVEISEGNGSPEL
jgi:hypothetical protein